MTEKPKPATGSQTRAFTALEFEKPILDIEHRIAEIESISKATGMNLNGEVDPLRERLAALMRQTFGNLTAWQQVQVARFPGRPATEDYLEKMLDEWVELHGDRNFRDDRALACGLARIGEERFVLVGHRKGRDTKDKIACNFGCAHPEGYRKALRVMKLAAKFGLPIVTLINTPGAYPGIGAEERGQAWAIAENLREMSLLAVPVICVVIGEGGSGGALGIGIGDRILILEHAYYSVISPEGCAAILWKTNERAPEAADALKLSAASLLSFGVVDEIVPEPLGAAHRNPAAMIAALREVLLRHLAVLRKIPAPVLLSERHEKFRRMGSLFESLAPREAGSPAGSATDGSKSV